MLCNPNEVAGPYQRVNASHLPGGHLSKLKLMPEHRSPSHARLLTNKTFSAALDENHPTEHGESSTKPLQSYVCA